MADTQNIKIGRRTASAQTAGSAVYRYHKLFEYMVKNHDLTLVEYELCEIVEIVRNFDAPNVRDEPP